MKEPRYIGQIQLEEKSLTLFKERTNKKRIVTFEKSVNYRTLSEEEKSEIKGIFESLYE